MDSVNSADRTNFLGRLQYTTVPGSRGSQLQPPIGSRFEFAQPFILVFFMIFAICSPILC